MSQAATTPAEFAELLEPGMTVFVHGTATEPRPLVDYLAANPSCLTGVHVIASFIPGINTVALAGLAPGLELTTFMAQPALADAIASGDAESLQLPYSRAADYLADLPALDVAVVHGRMLDDGTITTGVSGEFLPVVCERADSLVLLDNPDMPVPKRGCTIPGDKVGCRIEARSPLVEYRAGDRADAITERIADLVASLVRDGDTIQSGLGVLPNAVFARLRSRRDLTIYSGMISDSVVPLAASGALDPNVEHVYGMALGTEALFRWLNGRDAFRVADVVEAHDVKRMATIERFVGINSGLEVALDGSVNAVQLGNRLVSGPGGLPDFATGTARSPDGKSIVALPSANHKRGISRIVATLANHESPTIAAGVVTHVVTEHGIAELRDTDMDERAKRLIAVADPEFRDELARTGGLIR